MSNILAENLNRMMSESRLSASELGRRIDMPAVTIKKIRTGENENPTISTLKPIADYFKVSVSQLVGDTKHLSNIQTIVNTMGQKVNLVPIINWEDAPAWPLEEKEPKDYQTVLWQGVSDSAYALEVDSNEYDVFKKGGVLVVDPKSNYSASQYVLVYRLGHAKPSIRRILEEDGFYYLQSVITNLNNTVKLTDEYKVIGVVLAYEIKF